MRIFVTGALGLIGIAIANHLKKNGIECITADIRFPENSTNKIDICTKEKIEEVVKDCDGVIHLAAISRIAWGEKAPEVCNKINIDGTRNLLDCCLRSPKKPWFVFASSREVYGQQEVFPVQENCLLSPKNVYAKSKFAAEKFVERASNIGLKTFIVRFSNVYGGLNDHKDRVIPAFSVNALNNHNLRVDGKDCIYDFTYIDDVVDGLSKIVTFMSAEKLSYVPKIHLSTGVPTSLIDLAKQIITHTGSKSEIDIKDARTYSTQKFYGDYSRAKSLLGWSPKTHLSEGLIKFLTGLKNNDQNQSTYNNNLVIDNENFKSYSWLPTSV